MKIAVDCPHGMKVAVEEDEDFRMSNEHWRLFIRNTLLACPRCRFDADGLLEEAGK